MVTISAFYGFSPLSALERQTELEALTQLRGLVILAPEGCNGTVSGTEEAVSDLEHRLRSWPGLEHIQFKRSQAERHPFGRWKVDVRRETVSSGGWAPEPVLRNHLTPAEWHRALENPESVVLDVRNDYEVEIGSFRGAVAPGTRNFGEFGRFLAETELPRDRPLLTFCTGGIRCEKALGALEQAGFREVYQLDGGILNYLEHYPKGHFDGECYVFDDRVAVDQQLRPSQRFAHCGACGSPTEQRAECQACGQPASACAECLAAERVACSRDCKAALNGRRLPKKRH